MTYDRIAALSFLATQGRVLDRRRAALLVDAADESAVLAAVDGYRNTDGGYGWGLEPDLRSPESQPGGALHAFEVFGELTSDVTERTTGLCDWLAANSLEDGGLPFAAAVTDSTGVAPFWAGADDAASSLHITAAVAAFAHRAASRHPEISGHPWLATATTYCLDAIGCIDAAPFALELSYAVQFLDAVHDRIPSAPALLERLARFVPADGVLPVAGGSPDEALHVLDLAPWPDRPLRNLFDAASVDAELDRLADAQEDDGGWTVDFASYSPAATLEWRGYATVRALTVLAANER